MRLMNNEIEEVQQHGEEQPIRKPGFINQYNSYINCVDKCGQMILLR